MLIKYLLIILLLSHSISGLFHYMDSNFSNTCYYYFFHLLMNRLGHIMLSFSMICYLSILLNILQWAWKCNFKIQFHLFLNIFMQYNLHIQKLKFNKFKLCAWPWNHCSNHAKHTWSLPQSWHKSFFRIISSFKWLVSFLWYQESHNHLSIEVQQTHWRFF